MNKKSRRKRRHEKWRQQNEKAQREVRKEAQKERQRLKALPKPLRKLETDLYQYVDFLEVYDGYIGDFTRQIIPAEQVDNPFVIINEMELNFPYPNSLSNEQKEQYVWKTSDAFKRMGFYLDTLFLSDKEFSKMYELLLFHIENATKQAFDIFTSVNYEGITLRIERIDFEYIY